MAAALHETSLADRMAIVDLTITYCWAIDTHDWSALDRVFAPDATAALGGDRELIGIEAIRNRCATALTPLDDSQHIVANHQIDVDGDDATCRCYFQAQHVRRAAGPSTSSSSGSSSSSSASSSASPTSGSASGPNFIIAGRYEDRLRRTPAGWRIVRRDLVSMWRDGNVAVIRPD